MNEIAVVPAQDWESWVSERDAIVLDVREPDEWELGTLPDAVLISMGEIMDRVDELAKDKPILCVCHAGGRSAQVAAFLAYNGYEVANLTGGMQALGLQP